MNSQPIEPRIVTATGRGHLYRPDGHHGDTYTTRERTLYRFLMRKIMEWERFIPDKLIPDYRFRAFMAARYLCKLQPMHSGASAGDTTENDLMKLIFNATAIANLADNAASSPLTQLANALHTADPGEAGNQTTSESAYTSYARVNVNRNSGGWTVTANSVSPVAAISFPAGTGGSGTVTHFSIGFTGGGATKILFSGTVTPNIVTGNGVTPRLTTASTITID